MIIERLMDIFYGFIGGILNDYTVPKIPEEVINVIEQIDNYLITGIEILSHYFHLPYLAILLTMLIYVEIFGFVYNLTMWVIEKIPMLDIDR